ncbi:MAG: Ribonuclease HIII [Candidatus Anoxychlamydiales bacterium]|nr:Ribonuclease HIII [Candidatus Anoxychlamydiales bacterium]
MKKPNTFTCKLDLNLKDQLLKDLKEFGFSFTKPNYTIFKANKKNVVVVLYESGSLVVQGKEKDEFIEFYLEPNILKSFKFSHPHAHVSMVSRIGVDEAGKGDFFGPLCIAGVHADEDSIKKLIQANIRDSKKISDKEILKLAGIISKLCDHEIIRLFPEKYNELYLKFKNLNSLLAWGHVTVIDNLHKKTNCKNVIIDQFANKSVVENLVKRKKLDIDLEQRTKAEEDPVVAAASILARASFVKGIDELSKKYEIKLPKGASRTVIDFGKKFVAKYGPDYLEKVAKIHFKTKDNILNDD